MVGNIPAISIYIEDYMTQKITEGWSLYINIVKRILAVFVAQSLSILGAGSLVGIDVYQSALLAGIMGVAHVLEMLARKYIDDGKITLEEVNEVFNSVPTRK